MVGPGGCCHTLDECDCICHQPGFEGKVSHCAPCCSVCRFCSKDRIPHHLLDDHEKGCNLNPANLLAKD